MVSSVLGAYDGAVLQQLSLAPVEMDIELYSGDGVSITVNATNPNGTAMNLTGTIIAQIREFRTDASPFCPSRSTRVRQLRASWC